jgi:2-polyprenyl-6-methoxyphenol hydroxylase-like FAD-dependent oxidoreductase
LLEISVVVVGAGPVGLLTAIELTLGGVRVLVLERLAAASLDIKAGGLGPLGLEALERRGMAAAIAAVEARSFAAMAARHLHGRAATRRRSRSSQHACPGRHYATRSTVGRDTRPRSEALGLRRREPLHRRNDERRAALAADRVICD